METKKKSLEQEAFELIFTEVPAIRVETYLRYLAYELKISFEDILEAHGRVFSNFLSRRN